MTQPQPTPPRSRGNPSLGDMLRSIVVLGVVVAAVVAFTAFLREEPPDPAEAVDYQAIADQARDAVDYPLLAPSALPDGWRSNNARVEPGAPPAWHLGVLTGEGDYIGLEQQRTSVRDMVEQHADGSDPDGTAEVAGKHWSVRRDSDGNTTFVRRADDVSVLVTGDAPRQQIESYIASLRPVPR